MLAWTIYISFAGAIAVLLLPKGRGAWARVVALIAATATLVIALESFAEQRTGEMLTVTRRPWIPALGIEYHLAADGISVCLILLTGIIAVTGVLFSWNIEDRIKEFFAFYLLLVGSVYGVFLSYDLFLLFVF
jgi:NADH-quinone oxidoreductase subunit M